MQPAAMGCVPRPSVRYEGPGCICMHDTSLEKVVAFIETYLRPFRRVPLEVLDVGSRVVDSDHSQFRKHLQIEPWRYRGLDVEAGPNVDIVVQDPYRWDELAADSVDLVVSGQVLEHVPYFWLTAFEIGRVLKPGGLALLIAPSRGFEHRHPVDCWRFYRDGMEAIAAYIEFRLIDSFTDWDRRFWADSLLVMQKPQWGPAERTRFLRRRAWQQSALRGEEVGDIALPPEAVVSCLADAVPGRLAPQLERIRQRDLAIIAAHEAPDAVAARSIEVLDLGVLLREAARRLRRRLAG